jgi:hypothetical protein
METDLDPKLIDMMEKVYKVSEFRCLTPSSEHYRTVCDFERGMLGVSAGQIQYKMLVKKT